MTITYYIDTDQICDDNQDITYYDPNIDRSNWISLFSTNFNLPKNEVSKFLDMILKNDNLLEFIVIRGENSLLATTCFILGDKENEASLTAIYAQDGLLYKLLSILKPKALQYGIDRLIVTFTHLDNDSPEINRYIEVGFRKLF